MTLHHAFCPLLHTASLFLFFFFNDTATTEIYTLSLHDALPISDADHSQRDAKLVVRQRFPGCCQGGCLHGRGQRRQVQCRGPRSEEHTSELQSRLHLVCRLLLEKKKNKLASVPAQTHTNNLNRK